MRWAPMQREEQLRSTDAMSTNAWHTNAEYHCGAPMPKSSKREHGSGGSNEIFLIKIYVANNKKI